MNITHQNLWDDVEVIADDTDNPTGKWAVAYYEDSTGAGTINMAQVAGNNGHVMMLAVAPGASNPVTVDVNAAMTGMVVVPGTHLSLVYMVDHWNVACCGLGGGLRPDDGDPI